MLFKDSRTKYIKVIHFLEFTAVGYQILVPFSHTHGFTCDLPNHEKPFFARGFQWRRMNPENKILEIAGLFSRRPIVFFHGSFQWGIPKKQYEHRQKICALQEPVLSPGCLILDLARNTYICQYLPISAIVCKNLQSSPSCPTCFPRWLQHRCIASLGRQIRSKKDQHLSACCSVIVVHRPKKNHNLNFCMGPHRVH